MKANVKKNNNANLNFLAAEPEMAVRQLIALTKNLLDHSEQETGALVRGDIILLAALQDEKEKIASRYTRASSEFRRRIEEFRSIDRALLDQLEAAQRNLSTKTAENNALISNTRRTPRMTNAHTLFSAQEIGQNARVQSGQLA